VKEGSMEKLYNTYIQLHDIRENQKYRDGKQISDIWEFGSEERVEAHSFLA
jgi:hypothetical protein